MTKNEKQLAWSQSYCLALLHFLREKSSDSLLPAEKLGHHAVTLGLETLDVAKFHAHILTTLLSSDNAFSNTTQQETIKQAEAFFTETTIPIAETRHTAIKTKTDIARLENALKQQVMQLRMSKKQHKEAAARRQAAETTLKHTTDRNAQLLAEAKRLQKNLKAQTHQALNTQEDIRNRAASELRDEVAQALIAIDLSLLMLRKSGIDDTGELEKKIAKTQQLVQQFNQGACVRDWKVCP